MTLPTHSITHASANRASGRSSAPTARRDDVRHRFPRASFRDRLEIQDGWRFQPDPWGEGEGRRYYEERFDDSVWRAVVVPCGFDRCTPGLESYEGKGWYRVTMRAPDDWAGRRIILGFGCANYRCRVWLNGELLGEHQDGFLPFCFEVHGRLRIGEANSLAVLVDNTRRPGDVPGIQRGWRNVGGLLRPVALWTTGTRWIEEVEVTAEPDGRLTLRAALRSDEPGPPPSLVATALVLGDDEQVVGRLAAAPVSVAQGGGACAEISGVVAGIDPWSPTRPALYGLRVTLTADGRVLDTIDTRVGFRRIERLGTHLLLNGEPLYLAGVNRHEDSPDAGMATDLGCARQDLLQIRGAGANFVRFCHYPHSPGELDLCDEIGLLVMGEIPLWQWDEALEDTEANARKLAAAKRQLAAMIARDRNHPSVIFWSVSNENHAYQPCVRDGDRELIALVRELDPSRLVVHVCSYFWAEGAFDTDDVICFNGYPNIPVWQVRPGADRDANHPGAYFRAMIDELHERYPDKPILVTEFGHPSFEGVFGCQFGEDTQARLLDDAWSGMNAPYCCGATVWCYADHPWAEATLNALTTGCFGLVTRERRPRLGLAVVKRLFAERRADRSDPPKPPGPPSRAAS